MGHVYLDFPDKVELESSTNESAVPSTPRRAGEVAKLQLNPTTVLYIYKYLKLPVVVTSVSL